MPINQAQLAEILERLQRNHKRQAPDPEPVKIGRGVECERDLHDDINDFCRARGWLVVHSRMDRPSTQAKGVSDFIIATTRSVYFLECKRHGKKPTPDQQAFAAHIRKLGWPGGVAHNMDEFKSILKPEDRA